jgi:hypothetical protein
VSLRVIIYGTLQGFERQKVWSKDLFLMTSSRARTDQSRLALRTESTLSSINKISTTLQELEGFMYATTPDLNMGYYTIKLDPTAAKMCTIIFPWGKYSYQRLPMGFARSADIFQAEMGNLMATLEYVRAYIDNLLVITKGSLDDHLDKLKQVFI